MKKYTLHICSSFGRVDEWEECESFSQLRTYALNKLVSRLGDLEEGEEVTARIYHTTDLKTRNYWLTAIFSTSISDNRMPSHRI